MCDNICHYTGTDCKHLYCDDYGCLLALSARNQSDKPALNCRLTGFKGDFDATMKLRDDGNVNIQSLCGTVSIVVNKATMLRKRESTQTPEFYYS